MPSRETVIEIRNLSKLYRLGQVGSGTIRDDLNRWWAKFRGQEDPFKEVGQVNQRDQKSQSDYVWALRDVNLDVKRGEILGIIGGNGSGKSTLLKLISQITMPTSGSIRAKGRVCSLLEVGTGMHPDMTARENIYLNGAILGMRRQEVSRKFDDIVDFAGCQMYVDTPVKRFSSGMYVRLGFAVAAFLEPEILIIDEVLAVGDAEFQKRATGKMQEVSRSGDRTVLFVSHNFGLVNSICSSVVWLSQGTIRDAGDPHELTDQCLATGVLRRSCWESAAQESQHVAQARLLKPDSFEQAEESSEFLPGEPVKIELLLRNLWAVSQPVLQIFVSTSAGVCLFSLKADAEQLGRLLSEKGAAKLAVTTAPLPLLPGSYDIHLSLFSAETLVWKKETALRFEIVKSTEQQSEGGVSSGELIQIPHEWKVSLA